MNLDDFLGAVSGGAGEVFTHQIPERDYWLSFADPRRPEGQQFLGACVVSSPSMELAPMIAGIHGCNPGGECVVRLLREDHPPVEMYRLFDRAEVEAM